GQAAVAIENALLHQEISRLFEGFVSASVVAIEARDPTTAGHSSRVAALTLLLAESLERHGRGTYAGTRFILACNRPNLMEGGRFERLAAMAQISFLDSRTQPQPLLSESELKLLSLPRGTLSHSERAEIESHVTHTFRFLSQIPWARALRRVP